MLLSRPEQVGRREGVKVAASENRTLSRSMRARGNKKEKDLYNKKRRVFFCVIKVEGMFEG